MKILSMLPLWSAIFSVAVTAADKPAVSAGETSRRLKSPGGYTAKFVKLPGEGKGKTVISKDGKNVAEIPRSSPRSFSPTADVLLVREYFADDDCRHYLLDIGNGEFEIEGRRLDYVFGGRYVREAIWSADGKELTLRYREGMSDRKPETFKVKELLKR